MMVLNCVITSHFVRMHFVCFIVYFHIVVLLRTKFGSSIITKFHYALSYYTPILAGLMTIMAGGISTRLLIARGYLMLDNSMLFK